MAQLQQLRRGWTDTQSAAYDLIHAIGPARIGDLLGKDAKSVSNEVNPHCRAAKLGFEDAVDIELAFGDFRLLLAHAQRCHHACLALPGPEQVISDIEVLNAFARWQAAMGHTCQVINRAFEDHRITAREGHAIDRAGHAHMTRFLEFLERIHRLEDRHHAH